MGSRGPTPKRSTERRRRNKDSKPTKGEAAPRVVVPKPDKSWHPIAKRWYQSLAKSGQSEFYEPSDWAMAQIVAESISRDLEEQVVAVPEKTGEPVYAKVPMKGASLSAYLKAMNALMVSEGDRRRAGVELERAGAASEPEAPAGVVALDEYRRELAG
jgi:hypothetical protein